MSDQLSLSIGLHDSSVFASFVAGRNRLIVSALADLRSGSGPVCVFVSGAAGTGKSHLLQAVCAAAGMRQETSAYLPLAQLASLGPDVFSGCGDLAYVCVDDVERTAAQPEWERALFGLHQQLDERGGRLIVAAAQPPAAIGFGLADLSSRLAGGLVLTLQPLDDADRMAALQLRAHLRGFELPDDAAQYLMRRLPRDMNSLYAFLDELDHASLAAQRRLTLPFVREIVSKSIPA
ncbi:MAG: DnaA regulatory inactivator Hda [Steroidobacteraceae bacterium]